MGGGFRVSPFNPLIGSYQLVCGGCKNGRALDAIVVDIGGTSTDVGVVRNGIPRRSFEKAPPLENIFLIFRCPTSSQFPLAAAVLFH